MDYSSKWKEIKSFIDESKTFVLTTHINPDGDAIGSEIGMYHYLKSLSKEVHVINSDIIPESYHFLDKECEIIQKYEPFHDEIIDKCDVIIVLDISTTERLGRLGEKIVGSKAVKICIDHHASNNFRYNIAVIEQTASATGELVYFFLKEVGADITYEIAQSLYVAIMSDTGSFRFSNSSSTAHYVASELINYGINNRSIYEYVYENNPPRKVHLFAKTLATLDIVHNGMIASLELTQKMLKYTKTTKEDAEGFVDYLNTIKGVKLSLLFYEVNENTTKVSLRSKGEVDVDKLAGEFGGGGHKHSAGIFYHAGKLKDVKKMIINRAKQYW
jgi:phosphoesterase RecJ-like protein